MTRIERLHTWTKGEAFSSLGHSPFVVIVTAAQQCNHKSSINEDVSGHNPFVANTASCGQLGRSVSYLRIR